MRLLFALLAILSLTSCGSSKDKLYLFSWSEIFKPELIDEFENKFDCEVIITIYDSNESMYAKLKLGAKGYDLVVPSSYFLDILSNQKMIQSLDLKKIPNIKLLDPQYFKETNPTYGIPFLIGFSGLAYRQDRLKDFDPSWSVFARADLTGRMTMLNDNRDAIGAALKYLGYSLNSTNPDEIREAADLLIQWKKNLAKFESEQYKSGIASSEFLIVQGHTIDIAQVRREDENVVFVCPKEGSIMAIDYMVIPAEAKNTELAYAFINYMLEPEVAAQNMAFIHAQIPVLPAYELLDPKLKNDTSLFPSDKDCKNMEIIQDLGEAAKYYFKEWDRVKAN